MGWGACHLQGGGLGAGLCGVPAVRWPGSWAASGVLAYEVLIPLSSCLMAEGQDRKGLSPSTAHPEGCAHCGRYSRWRPRCPQPAPTPLAHGLLRQGCPAIKWG